MQLSNSYVLDFKGIQKKLIETYSYNFHEFFESMYTKIQIKF